MSMKRKNDRIVIIIVIVTILVLGYLIYFNIKKNTKVEINASIKETGNNYVVIIDDNSNEYKLNIDDNYEIGDRVNVILKNIKKGSPNTGEIVKIDTVSTSMDFSITDIPSDENLNNTNNNVNNKENIKQPTKETNSTDYNSNDNVSSNDTIISENKVNPETTIINYFNEFSNEVDSTNELKKTIKEKFVLVVDFLFYDGTIKDTTFKELSTNTKLKVLQIFLKIDSKIENKFPNYKQTISTTGNKVYTNAKNKALEIYFDLTTEICQNDPTLCETAKEGLSDLKTNFSLTWNFIKEITGIGISKLKSWYEIWKEI